MIDLIYFESVAKKKSELLDVSADGSSHDKPRHPARTKERLSIISYFLYVEYEFSTSYFSTFLVATLRCNQYSGKHYLSS